MRVSRVAVAALVVAGLAACGGSSSATFTQVSRYTLNVQQGGALLTGIRVVDVSQKTAGNCIQQKPARLTFTTTMKRLSP
jgi:hypothetical protein